MGVISAPSPLTPQHNLHSFQSGRPDLDHWLKKRALKAQELGGSARTFVVCETPNRVIGYYALATGAVQRDDAPGKVRRNMPEPIPVVILARLAVDAAYQGQGIGSGLLKDALLRVYGAAEAIGIRAVLVHALDDETSAFYRRWGFQASPTNSQTLMFNLAEIHYVLAV